MPRCTINADAEQASVIVAQNDRFRSEILTTKPKIVPGRVTLSPQVSMMDPDFVEELLSGVSHAWSAHPLADPHSERDCGEFTVRDKKLVWKIDLMPTDQRAYVAADRSDLERTWRVLAVSMAGEN